MKSEAWCLVVLPNTYDNTNKLCQTLMKVDLRLLQIFTGILQKNDQYTSSKLQKSQHHLKTMTP